MLLGLIIGAVSGYLQFLMLASFTKAITSGGIGNKAVLFGVMQFFLPLAVLIVCAFLLRESLIWASVGMAGVLLAFAFARFIFARR